MLRGSSQWSLSFELETIHHTELALTYSQLRPELTTRGTT